MPGWTKKYSIKPIQRVQLAKEEPCAFTSRSLPKGQGPGTPSYVNGCGSNGIPFWLVGEFTTHFRTYFLVCIGMFTGGIWILTDQMCIFPFPCSPHGLSALLAGVQATVGAGDPRDGRLPRYRQGHRPEPRGGGVVAGEMWQPGLKRSIKSGNPLIMLHGCCWETFYMFAYCGLVGSPHLTAEAYFCFPFQCQPRLRQKPICKGILRDAAA